MALTLCRQGVVGVDRPCFARDRAVDQPVIGIAHRAKVVFDKQGDIARGHVDLAAADVAFGAQLFGLPRIGGSGGLKHMFIPAKRRALG